MKNLVFALLCLPAFAIAMERHADGSVTMSREEEMAIVEQFNAVVAERNELAQYLDHAAKILQQQEMKIKALAGNGKCI